MLTTILLVIAAIIAVILILAATKPAEFSVKRDINIHAPQERIYPMIADFHRWGEWSPWEAIEPDMARNHSGAPSGVGAVYEWEGKKVGSGRMEVMDAAPPTKVVIQLDFIKPWKARNTTQFILEPNGSSTHVLWHMHGPNTFVGKVMSVFVSMDKMIGKDFEKGLAKMKGAAEGQVH